MRLFIKVLVREIAETEAEVIEAAKKLLIEVK
jgi:hypothetical protein